MSEQNVSSGFLLDPSGGSLKIHRLLPVNIVTNESPVLATTAVRTSGGEGGAEYNFYCSEMPCVNTELDRLHREAPGTSECRFIDRYLPLCCLLKGALDSSNSVPEQAQVRRMTITCLCGDPDHSVTMSKSRQAPCFPFDHSFPYQHETTYIRAGNRYIHGTHQRKGAVLHASVFIPPLLETVHYGTLPDLGMYIQGTLQRQYHDTGCLKHNQKILACLYGTNQPKCVTPIIATGLCCSIIQVRQYNIHDFYLHILCIYFRYVNTIFTTFTYIYCVYISGTSIQYSRLLLTYIVMICTHRTSMTRDCLCLIASRFRIVFRA